MRLSQDHFDKNEENKRKAKETFRYADISTLKKSDGKNFVKTHPASTAVAAVGLLVSSGAALASTPAISAEAASVDANPQAETMVSTQSAQTTVTEQAETMTVSFVLDGPGHVEAGDNCTVDAENNTVSFIDDTASLTIKLVADSPNVSTQSIVNGIVLNDTDEITLNPGNDYDVAFHFFDVMGTLDDAQALATDPSISQQAAARAAESQQTYSPRAESETIQAQPQEVEEVEEVVQTQVEVISVSTPVPIISQAADVAIPYSGAAQHAMNGDELAEAHSIFDAYNAYRQSRGLAPVAWSDDCANMAYGSALGCAATNTITQKLGIPNDVQTYFSDINQYSSWRMSASEAMNKWAQSTSHRRMLQCDTARIAGVGCYNNNGTWYYSIVYNFIGTNQSGE